MARVRLGRFPSVEGQLGRLALEQESIVVELIGEQLSALQGAIPSSEVLVELWVDAAEFERAQRVLSSALEKNAEAVGDVRCPACGKTSPANFDVCWSCQAALSGAEKIPVVAPELRRPRPPIFAAIFALTTLVLAVLLWKERQLAKIPPASPSTKCAAEPEFAWISCRDVGRRRDDRHPVIGAHG